MANKRLLDGLRFMLREKIEKNGHTIVKAAGDMGVSDAVLHMFLSGRTLSVSMAIRLAQYLGMPTNDVLRMAGHEDVANLLMDTSDPDGEDWHDWYTTLNVDPHATAISRAIEGLDDDDKQVVVENAKFLAEELRKRNKADKKGE